MEFTSNDSVTPTKALIRKGKRTLQEAFEAGKLSEADMAYIKCATDPYHDKAITGASGIPDEYVGKSVCEVFTLTKDISTPYSAGSGNWSCRIYNLPILGHGRVVRTAMNGSSFYQEVSNAVPPYNATMLDTIVVDFSGNSEFQDYPTERDALGLPQNALNGEVKVVGIGIEVINTTAELYKQGMFTAARIPQMGSASNITGRVYGQGGGGTAGVFTVSDLIPITSMPTRISELTTYPSYVQWEAKEGAYSVVKQYDVSSHTPCGFRGVLRYIDYPANGTAEGNYWGPVICDTSQLLWKTAGVTGMPINTYIQESGVITAPMDSTCMMFTGLSEQTTMTLRVKVYVERRVNASMVNLIDLVPLAGESPPFNPIALELVSQIWSNLPVAVMFKENPEGEWWDKVLGAIGDYGPSILGMIPHPLAQAASKALPHVTNAMKSRPAKTREQELQEEIDKLKYLIEHKNGQGPPAWERKRLQKAPLQLKAKPKPSGQRPLPKKK